MIFNSYDAAGYRLTITCCRRSATEDNAIVRNLRSRWHAELYFLGDAELVNEYDLFASSSMFGNDDEHFLEWLAR